MVYGALFRPIRLLAWGESDNSRIIRDLGSGIKATAVMILIELGEDAELGVALVSLWA
jgi:hypothetical protein